MAGIALKSSKYSIKFDNGLTATGKASTRSVSLKTADITASADTAVGALSGLASLSSDEVIGYSRKDEYLVSTEL